MQWTRRHFITQMGVAAVAAALPQQPPVSRDSEEFLRQLDAAMKK